MLIALYSDGSCLSSGAGGSAARLVAVLQQKTHEKEFATSFLDTTNNLAELNAVLIGLEGINGKGHSVALFSDSKNVLGWLYGWNVKTNQADKEKKFKINEPEIKTLVDCIQMVIDAKQLTIVSASYRSDADPNIARCHDMAKEAAEGVCITE